MSYINGKFAQEWIKENHPENGWFRAYWTEDGALAELNPDHLVEPQISLEDCGLGIRYEWEYKDGERADGKSIGWWPNGKIKIIRNWVNGTHKGLQQEFYTNGKIWLEEVITDDKDYGEFVEYDQDGKKMNEGRFRLEYLVDRDYGVKVSQPYWDENEGF